MPDLAPVDLKDGYRLVFQKAKENVRAVIRKPDGTDLVTGPIVPENLFMQSSRIVMTSKEWLDVLKPAPEPFDAAGDFAGEFDELDGPDDPEDEDDEY